MTNSQGRDSEGYVTDADQILRWAKSSETPREAVVERVRNLRAHWRIRATEVRKLVAAGYHELDEEWAVADESEAPFPPLDAFPVGPPGYDPELRPGRAYRLAIGLARVNGISYDEAVEKLVGIGEIHLEERDILLSRGASRRGVRSLRQRPAPISREGRLRPLMKKTSRPSTPPEL